MLFLEEILDAQDFLLLHHSVLEGSVALIQSPIFLIDSVLLTSSVTRAHPRFTGDRSMCTLLWNSIFTEEERKESSTLRLQSIFIFYLK